MTSLAVVMGDITTIDADAVVNAANSSLLGGGGVDGAIHRRGGPAILTECQAIRASQGGCDPGDAVATTAGMLPARWVIHTVGPIWTIAEADEHRATLASAYVRSIDVAEKLGAASVAFPNISTGIYGFPKPLAADVAIEAVRDRSASSTVDLVTFVCLDDENYRLYRDRLDQPRSTSRRS